MADSKFDFENDDELVAWFDDADLSELSLEEALDVKFARSLELVVSPPWSAPSNDANGSASSDTLRVHRIPEPA